MLGASESRLSLRKRSGSLENRLRPPCSYQRSNSLQNNFRDRVDVEDPPARRRFAWTEAFRMWNAASYCEHLWAAVVGELDMVGLRDAERFAGRHADSKGLEGLSFS